MGAHVARLKCPYCNNSSVRESRLIEHLQKMHPALPPPSPAVVSEKIDEYKNRKAARLQIRSDRKKGIKFLFERAYIGRDKNALATLLKRMKKESAVRTYVNSRLGKAQHGSRVDYEYTNAARPWQGGAPGLGKRS
jgi:23S rRNA G2069 N7-methylase RlmK/C1962 C5-methylase RlmI